MCKQWNDYLTDAEKNSDVEYFLKSFAQSGVCNGTLCNTLYHIRVGARILNGDIHTMTAEDFQRVKDGLTERYKGNAAKVSYSHFCRFYTFCTGNRPIDDTTVFIDATYQKNMESPELDKYRAELISSGKSEKAIQRYMNDVRHCLGLLQANGDSVDPREITALRFYQLFERMTSCRRDRMKYLRSLGQFVRVNTGSNPYNEFFRMIDHKPESKEVKCSREDLIDEFRKHRWDFDVANRTFEGYIRHTRAVLNMLEKIVGITDINAVRPEHIRQIKWGQRDIFDDKPLEQTTMRSYMTSFGIFCRTMRDDHVDIVKASGVRFHATIVRDRLTPEQFGTLYENADEQQKLMLALGAMRGFRRSDIAGFNESEINGDRIVLYGKGFGPLGKKAAFSISDNIGELITDVQDYNARIFETQGDSAEGYFFVNKFGRPLGGEGVRRSLGRLSKKTNIKFHPHELRALFAQVQKINGAPLEVIQSNLRHASPVTTQQYYLDDIPEVMESAVKSVESTLLNH